MCVSIDDDASAFMSRMRTSDVTISEWPALPRATDVVADPSARPGAGAQTLPSENDRS
jgi:hypothetical protein